MLFTEFANYNPFSSYDPTNFWNLTHFGPKNTIFGLFWAIKPEIFDFRWPNLIKYNIPVRFNDQKKNIPFLRSKGGKKCGFFVKFDVFWTKS